MASVKEYKCQRCAEPFTARPADRKRGWARFCSKSCKANRQAHTGHIIRALNERHHGGGRPMSIAELALGGYGDSDKDSLPGDGKW